MTTVTRAPETTGISLEKVISLNMKVALAMRGASQAELARYMGVSGGVISQKMRGRTSWTIPDMEKAGNFLKIAPSRFLEPNGLLTSEAMEPDTIKPGGLSTTGLLLSLGSLALAC
jgi:transcriptional regulator with XRE-family HTH domain